MLLLTEQKTTKPAPSDAAIAELDELVKADGIVAEETNDDSADLYGMEIVAEMETAWGNLTADMMAVEHKSVVTEDTALLEGAIGDYWGKVVEFFKRVWAHVQRFFSVILAKIKIWLNLGEKAYAAVPSANYGKTVEISGYANLKTYTQEYFAIEGAINRAIESGDKAADAGNKADVSAALKMEGGNFTARLLGAPTKISATAKDAKNWIDNVKENDKVLNDTKKALAEAAKKGIDEANKAKSAANATAEDKTKAALKVQVAKWALSMRQKSAVSLYRANQVAYSMAVKVCKAAAKGGEKK